METQEFINCAKRLFDPTWRVRALEKLEAFDIECANDAQSLNWCAPPSFEQHDQSCLSKLGYRVGNWTAITKEMRQLILSWSLFHNIPYICDDSYMARWGRPKTDQRLSRVKYHLTSLIEHHAGSTLAKARNDWIVDSAACDLIWTEQYDPFLRQFSMEDRKVF